MMKKVEVTEILKLSMMQSSFILCEVVTFKEDQRAFDGKTVPNLALFWMAVSIAGGRSSDISQQCT